MLVVALVSGGKDSCHALGLALQGGHEVACLANLAPPRAVMEAARKHASEKRTDGDGEGEREEGRETETETEDVDSHCFQTVGAVSVDALAAATGLPLIRRHLLSSSASSNVGASASPSVDMNLNYDDAVAGDEVEDLAALLQACKRLFPGIQGVFSGAVASDYQRLRVEHAAARAGGLVSVAPLWRKPQQELLEEMERDQLDAILVKVACVGLNAKHVGMRLTKAVPELLRLAKRFGVHPAGEGGEYETMTLDCFAFRRARLVVSPSASSSNYPYASSSPSFSVVDAGAGTFVATGLRLDAVAKNDGSEKIPEGEIVWVDDEAPPPRLPAPVAPPPAASSTPSELSSFVLSECGNVRARIVCTRSSAGGVQVSAVAEARRRKAKTPSLAAATATAGVGSEDGKSEAALFSDESVAESVAAALDAAGAALRVLSAGGGEEGGSSTGEETGSEEPPCPFSRATHIRLYLPTTMRSFSAANAQYGERMPRSNPPARACVACELGSGEGNGGEFEFAPAAVVDVLALPSPPLCSSSLTSSRSALHVQSISPWAPACIGPYAQAVTVGIGGERGRSPLRLLRMAGQIGLDPWTMELVSSSSAAGGKEETLSLSSRLEALRALRSCQAVAVACKADLQNGGMASCAVFASLEAGKEGLQEAGKALDEFLKNDGDEEEEEENEKDESRFEDEYLRRLPPPASRRTASPLRTFYLVSALPRGAAVEFEPLAWTSSLGDYGGEEGGKKGGDGISSWESNSATSRCDALVLPGRLCMARAVATRRSGKDKRLEGAFGDALEGIAAAAREAAAGEERERDKPLSLVSARAFFRSSSGEEAAETVASASAALARAWEGKGFAGAAPVAVPVAALGADPSAESDVLVEVHFETFGVERGETSSSDGD